MTKNDDRVSRRSLLAAAGAGLLTPVALADGNDRSLPNFSFLVISDTHLGRQDQAGPARQWAEAVRELNATPGDFVLHLGDIVDAGREAQYGVYRDIRRALSKPIHEIPGNHDPQDLFRRHVRDSVDMVLDHQGVRFLLFDNSRTDSHDGFITPAQLTWIEGHLLDAARRGLFAVLCCHVPVHTNRHPDRGWHVKPAEGQQALYALFGRHRRTVLALLHGHFHNGIRGWDDHAPLQEIVFPSALYNQDRQLAAQNAPGFYLAEHRPGFVQVTLGPAGLTLRYKSLGSADVVERVCPLPQFSQ